MKELVDLIPCANILEILEKFSFINENTNIDISSIEDGNEICSTIDISDFYDFKYNPLDSNFQTFKNLLSTYKYIGTLLIWYKYDVWENFRNNPLNCYILDFERGYFFLTEEDIAIKKLQEEISVRFNKIDTFQYTISENKLTLCLTRNS